MNKLKLIACKLVTVDNLFEYGLVVIFATFAIRIIVAMLMNDNQFFGVN